MQHSEKKLLTVRETADVMGIGRSLLYTLVMRGEIASIKIGRARRIPLTAIDDFIGGALDATTADQSILTTSDGPINSTDTKREDTFGQVTPETVR